MEQEFEVIKEKLLQEFNWLKEEYPISSFYLHPLKIFNYQDYNKNYKNNHDEDCQKKEIDAFLLKSETDEKIEYCIIMTFSATFTPQSLEKLLIEKGIQQEHLLYFVLYHEYGHLLQNEDIFQKNGHVGLLGEEKMQEQCLTRLDDQWTKKELTEEEYMYAYRDLPFEKEADKFAFYIYNKRKSFYDEGKI